MLPPPLLVLCVPLKKTLQFSSAFFITQKGPFDENVPSRSPLVPPHQLLTVTPATPKINGGSGRITEMFFYLSGCYQSLLDCFQNRGYHGFRALMTLLKELNTRIPVSPTQPAKQGAGKANQRCLVQRQK